MNITKRLHKVRYSIERSECLVMTVWYSAFVMPWIARIVLRDDTSPTPNARNSPCALTASVIAVRDDLRQHISCLEIFHVLEETWAWSVVSIKRDIDFRIRRVKRICVRV